MKTGRPYRILQQVSSVFMMLTLVWLTISMPVMYAAQQLSRQDKSGIVHHSANDTAAADDNTCNPFGNNAEEKAPASSMSEEYHSANDHGDLFHIAELIAAHTRYHTVNEYVAFHGEMLCPPPNRA